MKHKVSETSLENDKSRHKLPLLIKQNKSLFFTKRMDGLELVLAIQTVLQK